MDNITLFNEKANQYEKWFEMNPNLFFSEIAAIKQVMPDFKKGIEIGIGTGTFAIQLGIREGVEPAKQMREKAIAKGLQVFDAVAEYLPMADNTYDLAVMITVDCFLNDVLKAFQEVWRILMDDGWFIIAFIDKNTYLGRIYEQKKGDSEFYKLALFHSADEIKAYLQKTGFAIVDERQTIFDWGKQLQASKTGVGEGVFAVIKAKKALKSAEH